MAKRRGWKTKPLCTLILRSQEKRGTCKGDWEGATGKEKKQTKTKTEAGESMVSWKPSDEIIARRREGSVMTHTTDRSGKMTIKHYHWH